jgi:exodeoxyribonuclease X
VSAIIFDTETTGLESPEVIEAAWLRVDVNCAVLDDSFASRYRPSKPITLGAMATHHIVDADLVNEPPSSSFRLPDDVEYLIGHNVDFDWGAIGKPDVKRIDVLAMCRAIWPEADSHSQGAMLYLLIDHERARTMLHEAHSALADVFNCRAILIHVLRKVGPFATFDDLWQASERMRVPTKINFGKHRGMAIRDLPRDYRQWLMRQPDLDQYLLQALRSST